MIKDALLTFLLCYSFMFTVPTTVDRAYSVRMLSDLGEHPNGLSGHQISQRFGDKYASGSAVEKRLNEQLATGSVYKEDGLYHLTPFGQYLVAFFNFIESAFSTRRVNETGTER